MKVEPDFERFASGHEAGKPQLVWTRLIADLETTISVMLKLADGRTNSILLESVEGGAVRGRYSIIGLKPDLIWRCRGSAAEINRNARFEPEKFTAETLPALDSLRALIKESRIEVPVGLPPMASGLFGYLGYDMVRYVEELPAAKADPNGVPEAMLMRPGVVLIFDGVKQEIIIAAPERGGEKATLARIDAIEAKLDEAMPPSRPNDAPVEKIDFALQIAALEVGVGEGFDEGWRQWQAAEVCLLHFKCFAGDAQLGAEI